MRKEWHSRLYNCYGYNKLPFFPFLIVYGGRRKQDSGKIFLKIVMFFLPQLSKE